MLILAPGGPGGLFVYPEDKQKTLHLSPTLFVGTIGKYMEIEFDRYRYTNTDTDTPIQIPIYWYQLGYYLNRYLYTQNPPYRTDTDICV